jgi:SPP1 gp7 family putative phage head morphogenesis protein
MAKTTKSKVTTKRGTEAENSIVVQNLHIGQLNRGNQTIQTWYNSIRSAESQLTPNRKAILNTYLDVTIDLHLRSVTDKRSRAVKTQPFEWVGLKSEAHIENFQAPWFNDLLGLIMKRVFWGPVVCEFLLGQDSLIDDVIELPAQNIKPEKSLISFDGSSDNGVHYNEPPYNNYILQIGRGRELGLLANIAPYVLMKRQNLADFSRFNEMFGMPLRWYEYDPLDPGARDQVKRSAEEMGSCAYVIVPKGTTVNFVESTKQATAYTYDKFHEIMNNEITIGVLGQLLTTGGQDGGSYSLGQVHKAVEQGVNLEDRLIAEYILNYPFKNNILIPHGYPMEGVKGKFKMTEELSKEIKAKIYVEQIAPRFPIDPKFIYEEFGIPEPTPEGIAQWKEYSSVAKPEPIDANNPEGGPEKPKKKPKALAIEGATLLATRALYASTCTHKHHGRSLSLSYNSDLNELVEDLVKKIWNREISAGDVDPELWDLVSKELTGAVERGFNLTKTKGLSGDMLNALKSDVQVFSGFKNYQMLREATDLLYDDTGALRGFDSFRDEVLKLNQEYNVSFLKAEYNHAVGSSRMAAKWQGIVKNKETLPLLEYLTAGDGRVRDSHAKLNRIVLPMDHPFWDTYMPPNDWNCRCNVRQLADGELSMVKDDQLPQLKDEFKFNPGKEKVIFPKSHPYYKVASKDQGSANNNFGLPIK